MSDGLLARLTGRSGTRAADAGAPDDVETEAGSGPEDEEDAERAPEASADKEPDPATDDATASTPAAADGEGEDDDTDENPRADAPADAASFEAGQRAERARWASVMPAAIETGQGAAAAELLTTSEMTADAVTGFLANHSTAGPTAAGFVDRMRAQKQADIGVDAPGDDSPGARLATRISRLNPNRAGAGSGHRR
jgi:hypothetical protein